MSPSPPDGGRTIRNALLGWVTGSNEPKLSDRHDLFTRLSYREINRRVDAAERAVLVSALIYIVFAALLWIWLVAPSFSLLPAAIRAVLTVVAYLGYGIFGAANSPVTNFASYINLGYGIIAGTPILALLLYNWLNKERNLTGTLNAIYVRPDLQPFKRRPRRRLGAIVFAVIAFIGVTSASQNRFLLLAGRPEGVVTSPPEACYRTENWSELWAGSSTSFWGWLWPHHSKDDLCVRSTAEFLAAYSVILPHSVFEAQLDKNRKLREEVSKIQTNRLSADLNVGLGTVHAEWGGASLDPKLFESHFMIDPWLNWPDIRPPLNLLILWLAALAQILVFFRIYRHTSARLIV